MVKRILGIDSAEFERVIISCDTYGEAAAILGVHIKTINTWAKKLGVTKSDKTGPNVKLELQEILDGKHPQYPTYMLKQRLIKEGLLIYECVECKIVEYNSKPIVLELDHIDGDKYNHVLPNLRLLCPNCHSQTETYKSKNKKLKRLSITEV